MKQLGMVFLVSLVCLSLMFGAISCAKPAPPSVTPPTETPQQLPTTEVKILESKLISGIPPYDYIFGEIQNIGDMRATHISLIAEFYDERGYLLDRENYEPVRRWLNPGEKSPFKIPVWALGDSPKGVPRLKLEYEVTDPVPPDTEIKILNHALRQFFTSGYLKGFYLEVEVLNTGDKELMTGKRLIVTFYDAEGKILSYGTGGTGSLLPNQVRKVQVWPEGGLMEGTPPEYVVSNNYSLVID